MNENVEQWRVSKPAVVSEAGVVAAQHWQAAAAGASALHDGGNAIDAAVATAFALGIVEPWMCGLGGSGYLVAWLGPERRAVTLDFQGVLPADICFEDYQPDPSLPQSLMGFPGVRDHVNVRGYRSCLVPGAAAGLAHAVERFGRLGLDTLMRPSLELAERGLPVDWHATLMIALEATKLANDPGAASWLLPHGLPPTPERWLLNPALARTYRALADDGPGTIYGGAVGERMASDLAEGGSRITLDDFAAYRVIEAEAPGFAHRGHLIHTAGPTSGGPRLEDALAYLSAHLGERSTAAPATWAALARALDHAFGRHRERFGLNAPEAGCTSHLSVADAEGNMAALTFTLLNRFGAGVLLPQTGVLMNNAVSYFDPRSDRPTSLAPGRRINASNMCPTVAVRDDEARFAVGASGANHIVPCCFQLTAFMLDLGLDLETAFHLPRIDAAARGSVRVDPRLDREIIDHLGRDFALEIAQRMVFPKLYACPSGVARDLEGGTLMGIADPSSPIASAAAAAPFALSRTIQPDAVRA